MMAARRENSRHKRLFHLRHLGGVKLQKRFVPNSPIAIELRLAAKFRCLVKLRATIIFLEASRICKSLKTHAAILCAVKKRRLITFLAEFHSDAIERIERRGSQEKRLYKIRNTTQDARHTVNGLATVAITLLKNHRLLSQTVDKRRVALVVAVLQILVVTAHKLPRKTLNYQHHNVFALVVDIERIHHGLVERGVDTLEFVNAVIFGIHKSLLIDGANDGKRRIQNKRCLNRAFYVLIGIADGDRARTAVDAATNAHYRHHSHHSKKHHPKRIIFDETKDIPLRLETQRIAIQLPQNPNQNRRRQYQIPLAQRLLAQNLTDIVFVFKLLKNARRAPAFSPLKITGIHQIGNNGH